MPKPFISVLIDTYNHERFIEQVLHSVFAQDYPADRENIVVPDNSTKHTPEILARFQILRKRNGGQATAIYRPKLLEGRIGLLTSTAEVQAMRLARIFAL